MGIFDIPTPLLQWADDVLAWVLPAPGRIALWALAAAVSMGLYARLSPQSRIELLSKQIKKSRAALLGYDDDFAGMLRLARDALIFPLRQMGLILGPAFLASAPCVCVIVWASTAYGYHLPVSGEEVEVSVSPATAGLTWTTKARLGESEGAWILQWPEPEQTAVLLDLDARQVISLPLRSAVPIIHKKRWWNTVVGNPGGYLPDDVRVEEVSLRIPKQQIHSFGPTWTHTWELMFFGLLVLFSLIFKKLFKIH